MYPSYPSVAFDPSGIMAIFFWLAFLISGIFVATQLFHWFRYGSMYPLVWVAMPVYVIGTLILIGGMLAGLAAV